MTDRAVSGWLSCRVTDPARVATVRDHLYGWLGAPDPYRREETPHVSVFGFSLPEGNAAAFQQAVRTLSDGIGPWEGPVDGYHVWPSTRNPMVVTLDVPFPLEAFSSPLADLLAAHDGRIERGPTHPHITLFKGGVRGEQLQWAQVPEATRDRLRAATGESTTDHQPPDRLVNPSFEVTIAPPRIEWHDGVRSG